MRLWVSLAAVCAWLLAACGDSGTEFTQAGTGGSAGATGGSGGSTAGAAGGGGAAAGSGGATPSGGSAGSGAAPSGGAAGSGAAGVGGATGGTGGAPTCPGTAPGCVIDWAGQFGQQGAVDGVGTQARFNAVGDITGDATHLWVATDNAVRRIEISSATVTTFAGQLGASGYVDATGTAARFAYVAGIATDGKTVWVTDSGNNVIRAVDIATKAVTAVAGAPGQPGSQDGIGNQARFTGARGLAYDGKYLYLAEEGNSSVRRIDPKTGEVITLGGNNGQGATNGAGSVAQFDRPRSIEVFKGTVYVGDTENSQVRALVPGTSAATSTVTTPLGAGPGYLDGTGNGALFRRLRGIGNDGSALIVADSDNFVIRKVDLPSLVVTTIAGTGMNQGHAEGIGPAAAFDKPMDVHFDPGTGDLFIVEGTVIRRMYYK